MDANTNQKTRIETVPASRISPFLVADSHQRAGEYCRLALQYLSRHKAPPIPLNYALGYFYASGFDARFREKMDELLGDDQPWAHETAVELFYRFLKICNDQSTGQIEQELLAIVNEIVESVSSVSQSAGQRSDKLNECATRLADCHDPKQALMITTEVLHEARALSSESETFALGMQTSAKEVERLKEELASARQEATTDALTGLQNRRVFDSVLSELITLGDPFSLILMDIDYFKKINDEHGHLIGDRVLKQLAKVVSGRVRSSDCVSRYGGEEFAIVLPKTHLLEARLIAEKIRTGIGQLNMRRSDNKMPLGQVTASFGVTEYRGTDNADDLVSRADKALYHAKHNGRNRVESA